jgi:hypothetical protein
MGAIFCGDEELNCRETAERRCAASLICVAVEGSEDGERGRGFMYYALWTSEGREKWVYVELSG